jgi:hypothetical protein
VTANRHEGKVFVFLKKGSAMAARVFFFQKSPCTPLAMVVKAFF